MTLNISALKAPVGGKYERGACEPIGKREPLPAGRQGPPNGDVFPGAPVSRYTQRNEADKALLKKMQDPKWQARQVALLREAGKKPSDTERFFGNMLKIAALPFALLGSGCVIWGDTDTPVTDSGPGLDGGRDAAMPIGDGPTFTWPQLTILPNNRAFVRWDPPQTIPPGKILAGYEISWNDGTNNFSKPVTFLFTAIDIINPNTQYDITARAMYNDATFSQDSMPISITTDSSLRARYIMDEGVGEAVHDSSGNDLHGTMIDFNPATAWTQGISGAALLFDVWDGSYVNTGNAFNFDSTDSFTIDAWVRRTSVGEFNSIFVKWGQNNVNKMFAFGYYPTSNKICLELSSNWPDNRISITTTQQFSAPYTSHNVATTYNGSMQAAGAKIYVDGVEEPVSIDSDELNGSISNNAPSCIGANLYLGNPSEIMDGIIDDLAIYNRVLTQDEIVNNTCAREALNREENNDSPPLPTICD